MLCRHFSPSPTFFLSFMDAESFFAPWSSHILAERVKSDAREGVTAGQNCCASLAGVCLTMTRHSVVLLAKTRRGMEAAAFGSESTLRPIARKIAGIVSDDNN